jgi:flagellar basal-body rod modification protein FlgD
MTTVAASSAATTNPFAAFNTQAKAASSTDSTAQQDRFLTLLTAQLKNQDPLNPTDNAQLTSQLAQISTVDGIEKLNTTLGTVLSGNQDLQAMQATSLVGRDVLAAGSSMALAGGVGVGGFELANGADAVTITIKSEAGQVVHRATLAKPAGAGAWPAGVHTFDWDGKTDAGAQATAGNYTFSVEAKSTVKGVSSNADSQPLAMSRVDGVTRGAGGGVTLQTSSGAIDYSKIRQVM